MSIKIILKAEREKSLLRKHPWVFDGAIEAVQGNPRLGSTVDVFSHDNTWLAKGAFSPHSQIRVRVWTFEKDAVIDNNFFKNRIAKAKQKRQQWLELQDTNAYRLIAGESDGLPGITVDVYNKVVVIQLLSAGGEKHRSKIIDALSCAYPGHVIHERSDVEVRQKEGLPLLVQTHVGELPEKVVIRENRLNIEIDLVKGHKTGFYLDQRINRQISASFAKNKDVLNCFSYTGTFALYAALNNAKSVSNIDVSENALATSKRNLEINSALNFTSPVTHIKADVFEQLRLFKEQGKRFDIVIMDPPKFIENKRHVVRASRAYKDINRLACELLNDGGLLITFSCSGLMPADLFQKIIADAALDANVSLNFVQRLHQDFDHMVAGSFPEGYYLKGLVAIKSGPV